MKKIELPDFDDMIKLASEIGNKKTKIMLNEADLDLVQAEITDTVTKDEKYWVGGKPPSNAHITSTYHILGISDSTKGALAVLRTEIAMLTGDLRADELLFRVNEEMIDVWRTQSASERKAYLDS
jgi:hypothetical protein